MGMNQQFQLELLPLELSASSARCSRLRRLFGIKISEFEYFKRKVISSSSNKAVNSATESSTERDGAASGNDKASLVSALNKHAKRDIAT